MSFFDPGYVQHLNDCKTCQGSRPCPREAHLRKRELRRREAIQEDARRAARRTIGYVNIKGD